MRSRARLLPAWLGLLMAGCSPSAKADLTEVCAVADATLMAPRGRIDNALARAGQALIYQTTANRYALLEMPACRVTPLKDVPERIGLSDVFLQPGGARLFSTSPAGRIDLTWWWYAHGPEDVPARVTFLPDRASPYSPLLSDDGLWVAWPRIGDRESFRVDVVMQHPDGSGQTTVTLPGLEPDTYELLQLDVSTREVTLVRGLADFMRIGFDGAVRWRERVRDVAAQSGTFVRFASGYFAWDASRDGPYRIGWSLPAGRDTLAFERLRQIQHAAVDPLGELAAVSLETQHGRLLSLSDAIVVVRLGDRREVFRTYLPRYTRSHVAFLTDTYVAYADTSRVHVLRVR